MEVLKYEKRIDLMKALSEELIDNFAMPLVRDKRYVMSITLRELIRKLQEDIDAHPEHSDMMIYFDCLHIIGEVDRNGDILELI